MTVAAHLLTAGHDSASEIVRRILVIEHADELKRRLMVEAIPVISVDEPAGNVVRVGTQAID